jgi:hypothetical protein
MTGDEATNGPKQLWSHTTVNVADAEAVLLEAKSVLDAQGVPFFLRQGTCLGAVRDGVIMPWDDDVDIGSIFGMHGFTEQMIEPAATALRERGFEVTAMPIGDDVFIGLIKLDTRVDWFCYRVKSDFVTHYPGVEIPIRLFVDLAEINFLSERFLIPNPPEEYLSIKYGPDWTTPKPVGYERDALGSVPDPEDAHWYQKLGRRIAVRLSSKHRVRFDLRDSTGEPLAGATVTIAGASRGRTDAAGHVTLYVPNSGPYAVIVGHGNTEEILYEEVLTAGHLHVYTADAQKSEGRTYVLVGKS